MLLFWRYEIEILISACQSEIFENAQNRGMGENRYNYPDWRLEQGDVLSNLLFDIVLEGTLRQLTDVHEICDLQNANITGVSLLSCIMNAEGSWLMGAWSWSFERKVLRSIFGGKLEKRIWCRRTNHHLDNTNEI